MLIRLLGFGPVVRVLGPESFVALMRERVRKQAALLAQGKSKLTPEVEQEILTLRGKGYSVRKIADHMKLSKSAVDRVVQKHKDSEESSADAIKDAQFPDNAA